MYRAFFRFGFVYLILYSLGGVLAWLPFVGGYAWLAVRWLERGLVALAAKLLRLEGPVTRPVGSGSGDTRYDWVRVFALLLVAIIVAIGWSVAARRRRSGHRMLGEVLHVWTRFVLGTSMLGYGLAKVLRSQFTSLDVPGMMTTYGESSPMGLLWRFMDHSAPYTIFCGAVETAAGVLLFHRRAATLGALVAGAAMTNVLMLNLSYDVPVKLSSTHLLTMAIVVAAPDLPRIARAVLGRATPSAPPTTAILPIPSLEKTRRALEIALGLVVLAASVTSAFQRRKEWGDGAPRPALAGFYKVESFERAGEERPPLTTDAARWESFAVSRFGSARIRRMTGTSVSYRLEDDPKAHVVRLFERDAAAPITLAYERKTETSGDTLRLSGVFEGEPIVVTTNRLDESKLLLASRGFHFVQEYPFNR
jgi:hypothetical protein